MSAFTIVTAISNIYQYAFHRKMLTPIRATWLRPCAHGYDFGKALTRVENAIQRGRSQD